MEGFAPVSLQQLAAADRELHVRLAELTRAGFRAGPAGELPLDVPATTITEWARIEVDADAYAETNGPKACSGTDQDSEARSGARAKEEP